MDENYKNLINAIVLQAFRDLRSALRHLRKHPDDQNSKRIVSEVEQFCGSPWCEFLIGFDGAWLYRRFEERINGIHYYER